MTGRWCILGCSGQGQMRWAASAGSDAALCGQGGQQGSQGWEVRTKGKKLRNQGWWDSPVRGIKRYTGRGESSSSVTSQIARWTMECICFLVHLKLTIEEDFGRMILLITAKLFCSGIWICCVCWKGGKYMWISDFWTTFCNAFFSR